MGPKVVDDLRNHPLLARSRGGVADLQFTRAQLVEVGRTLPEEWMRSGAALGSAEDCCDRMREYFDAGVDEIWIHCTSPTQNAGVIELWRQEYRTRRNPC
jgi:alkanesulfonate monooxygenase SsuD/methylene tetrahydromethanopterin reductase-like flavin-dependent oxidoreductase (luciferase family)